VSGLLNGEEEIRCLETSLEIAPKEYDEEALLRLGEIYDVNEEFEKAEKYYRQAWKKGSKDALDYLMVLKKKPKKRKGTFG